MERLLRPAFEIVLQSPHFKDTGVKAVVTVPNQTLPMDLYNALLFSGFGVEPQYGWITSLGRYVDGETAGKIALEFNMLDKSVKHLTVEDYQGSWKRKG